jgi:Ser/Thr protein kinase RdoA (MazF antagonist)
MTAPHALPPAATLSWCCQALAAEYGPLQVLALEQLHGGLDAMTHRLTLQNADSTSTLEVVLRRLQRQPVDRARAQIENEQRVLAALAPHPSWPATPRCLAADPAARSADAPAILLDCLPGAPNVSGHSLQPRLTQFARALARLHARRLHAPAELETSQSWLLRTPPSAERPWAGLCQRLLPTTPYLIHADYHLGNVLFVGDELSGVVDWGTAEAGPHELDVGYCRLDLEILFGPDAAAQFLACYEQELQLKIADLPLWDLWGSLRAPHDIARWLPAWHALGRTDLTPHDVRQRHAQFVQRALAQVAS